MSFYIRQLVVFICFFSMLVVQGQDAAETFKKHCGACHSLGGGKLVGPDLAGISQHRSQQWIRKFILNSAEFIASGDPDAVAISKEFNGLLMPPFPGTTQELTVILQYLKTSSASVGGQVADTFLNAANESNRLRGEALFSGMSRFVNAGAECNSCHSIHGLNGMGGTLAKSLTFSWYTMKGQGIKAILQSPPFPSMTAAYQDHPLTDEEIYDVAAFMKATSKEMVQNPVADKQSLFPIAALAGWIIVAIVLLGLWRMRKRVSVNRGIFLRQLKSER